MLIFLELMLLLLFLEAKLPRIDFSYDMSVKMSSENDSNISFQIPVKPKKEAPKTRGVSSIFKKQTPTQPKTPINIPIQKKKIVPKIKVTEGSIENKAPKESPFLRRLKQEQQNIKPPPPVPTEQAYKEGVPISGFGEICLRRQGWEPGKKIGKIIVPSDDDEKVDDPQKAPTT